MNATAIILSGGRSSRMGEDKALLPFWGKPIITHVFKHLTKLTNKVVISANSDNYNFLDRKVIKDIYEGHGPLAGLHAALKVMETELAFVATCDSPLINHELYLYLLEKYEEGVDAVVPVYNEKVQPLIGIYNKSNVSRIEQALKKNEGSVMRYLEGQNVRYVEINESLRFYSRYLFMNLNKPDEYEKLLIMEEHIKVLYFGITSDIAGKSEEFLSPFTDVGQLKTELFTAYPELKEQPFKISVNQVFANDNFKLYEGDEIALLPPFAGG